MKESLSRIGRTGLLLQRVPSLVLLFLVCLLVADAIGRLLGRPITGSYELTQYGFALIVSFSVAYAGLTGSHLVIDIVFVRLPRPLARLVSFLSLALSAALFGLVSFRLFVDGIEAFRLKERSSTLGLPIFLFMLVLALGFALLVTALVTRLMKREEGRL
jgi:TRAP-type C4-dicarboxylate transport system permease small subunit